MTFLGSAVIFAAFMKRRTITFQPEEEVEKALNAAVAAMGGGHGAKTAIINDACRSVLGKLLKEKAAALLKVEQELPGNKGSSKG